MSVENLAEAVILIVDDTPTNLGMLCDFLADAGFEVLVATEGESAIAQAVYAQPNLILLDILMPGLDGFETCRQLKANPSTQDIPVIFMTALGETADKVKGFQVGAVDYVTKPIQPEEVLARITNHLTIQTLQKELQLQNLQLQQEVKERQRAEELVRQQAQQEKLLSEIAQRIRKSLDLDEILDTTVSEVRQFLQSDRVLIYRFFEDWSGVVDVEAVNTPSLSILNTQINDPCFEKDLIQPYQKGRIQVTDDIYTAALAPCYVELLLKFQIRANLVIPILQGEQLWGLLIAHHCCQPRQWQPLEIDLLQRLSTQIAIAIQQGQLYQRLRRQNQVLVTLAKSRTVNYGDLNSTLKQVTEAAAQTLEIERVGVWLYSSDYSKIHCLDLFERSTNCHTQGIALMAVDYPAYFKALEQELTLAVPDADTKPIALDLQVGYLPFERTAVGFYGETAILDAPIRVGGQIVGVVLYEHLKLNRQWALDEQNFAGSLADVVSLSLEARERQRAEEKIRLLQTITQAISESPDFDSALEVTLRNVCETIGWNFGEAWIPNSDKTFLECSPAWYASNLPALEKFRQDSQTLRFAPGVGLPGRVWSSKQPEWIQDVAIEPDTVFVRSPMVFNSGLCSCLGIPIVVNDQVLTVFVFFTLESRQPDQQLIDLVWAVGTQLGVVIQRKQAEEALRIAEQRYHSIVENAIEGIFQTTPSGRFLSANPALARFFGYSSPEELITSIKDIGQQIYVEPNRRGEFIAAIQEDNAVFELESLVYRKDGSVIWVSENTRAVRDSAGTLLYYEGTLSDITARKVAGEAVRYLNEQSEQLLLNILPEPIAQQLKRYPDIIADSFEGVSVLFADIVGFTEFSAQTSAKELVQILNLIFSTFDQLAERHGLEKIKTIGDAYMVAGGLPTPRSDHAIAIAEMALDMQSEMVRVGEETGNVFKLRIGINSGPVVAGVIGIKKFIYDLWGDTVNVASRMESQGVDGAIQVTATTYELLRDKYLCEERGIISVKGKGEMTTYLLTGRQ
ncbi:MULTISPECIES: adenylate/guanylate cyclase domain-containing protein [unclassified Coleofasciculus]|uniref:adenylate/guanylate cyclase domain-containing protein n=1 Tax=unclassified Coleofasciculus TaxID=2692782 RepID=UPI0018814892|nr:MULTISPECIES: adenylate/guanylate cyclase domain-containing protein [unclassified Coleofasciculus]MBE9127351.1 GAF domain-containing protein [Coleofasciculus sp. LEGE 07081]MBE9150665.1 GAF domain-containing protein [Coleofasciculus sp. LEGE 07092]